MLQNDLCQIRSDPDPGVKAHKQSLTKLANLKAAIEQMTRMNAPHLKGSFLHVFLLNQRFPGFQQDPATHFPCLASRHTLCTQIFFMFGTHRKSEGVTMYGLIPDFRGNKDLAQPNYDQLWVCRRISYLSVESAFPILKPPVPIYLCVQGYIASFPYSGLDQTTYTSAFEACQFAKVLERQSGSTKISKDVKEKSMSNKVVVRYKHKTYQNFGVHKFLDKLFDGIAAELQGRCESEEMWQRSPIEKKRVYMFDDAANAKIFKETLATLERDHALNLEADVLGVILSCEDFLLCIQHEAWCHCSNMSNLIYYRELSKVYIRNNYRWNRGSRGTFHIISKSFSLRQECVLQPSPMVTKYAIIQYCRHASAGPGIGSHNIHDHRNCATPSIFSTTINTVVK